MSRTIHKTDKPVTLEGFQAILAPSKFGYSLAAIVDADVVDKLETERAQVLKWAESKLKILSVVHSSPNHGKRSLKVNTRSNSPGMRRTAHLW